MHSLVWKCQLLNCRVLLFLELETTNDDADNKNKVKNEGLSGGCQGQEIIISAIMKGLNWRLLMILYKCLSCNVVQGHMA